MDEKKSLNRTYRFDPTTARTLSEQAPKFHCSESEFIRRLILATRRPDVTAVVFGNGHDCQEQAT